MFILTNIVNSLFPQPYTCTFKSVENYKVSETWSRVAKAVRQMDLNTLQKLSNRDLNFKDKDGNTLLHLLVASLYLCTFVKKDEIEQAGQECVDKLKVILSHLIINSNLSVCDTNNEGNSPITLIAQQLGERKCESLKKPWLKSDADFFEKIFDLFIHQPGGKKALSKRNCYNLTAKHYLASDIQEIKFLDGDYLYSSLDNFCKFKEEFNKGNPDTQISAEQFDAVVKAFKLSFKIKSIKKIFSLKYQNSDTVNYLQSWLQDVFLADNTIRAYLSRPIIKTQNNELVLDSKYEKSLYMTKTKDLIPSRTIFRCMGESDEKFVPFSDPRTAFYLRGIISENRKYLYNSEDLKADSDSYRHIKYLFENDIYEASSTAYSISNDFSLYRESSINHNFTYFVLPGAKDSHAYLMAVVFDTSTEKLVCSFLVNSWKNEFYSRYLECRYKARIKDTLFIDCSIDVQLDPDDSNCIIYSSNIGRGLVKLLGENEEHSDRVFKTFQEDGDPIKIQEFIRNSIVEYLPQYFYQDENQVFQRRSKEELRDFHMQVRWDLGNRYIQEQSALAKKRLSEDKG